MPTTAQESGLIELTPENIENVPDGPGVFQIISVGQKVVYVGHSGDRGLRESIWEIVEEHVLAVASFFRYVTTSDEETARELALQYVERYRPPHNVGYGRYRSGDTTLPRQGHRVRQAVPNPP